MRKQFGGFALSLMSASFAHTDIYLGNKWKNLRNNKHVKIKGNFLVCDCFLLQILPLLGNCQSDCLLELLQMNMSKFAEI